MIMIAIYSVLYTLFLCLDYSKVKRCGKNSIRFIYLSSTILTYILIILIALNIPIPNPNNLIERIVTAIIDVN